jgi:sensor domain CHASE-containing protein
MSDGADLVFWSLPAAAPAHPVGLSQRDGAMSGQVPDVLKLAAALSQAFRLSSGASVVVAEGPLGPRHRREEPA